ncbi:AraC family transcriptional regulator [Flammeovirga pectinis]|uniref:AraC family transcriptional regulator n=1 Tax=Flammeovirga pectinis TaxID=2494373 RepID=A0A3Q9FT05_9BACT|nr:AraC family transcriptional regulator [Flammeovirga pectinis]AZQ63962.1 AraC family transcriptional regulator [Flammeovirga pectinis]
MKGKLLTKSITINRYNLLLGCVLVMIIISCELYYLHRTELQLKVLNSTSISFYFRLFFEIVVVFILSLLPYSNYFSIRENEMYTDVFEKEFIKDIDVIIADNLSNVDFQVTDIEHSLGLSRPVLLQKIKLAKGTTLVNYIKYKRIEKAKFLLVSTTNNISEIAYKVGYTDPKYFSKTFKKQEKKSPSQYRKLFFKTEEVQNEILSGLILKK